MVTLNNIAQVFNNRCIFKDVNRQFQADSIYAITGPNGSGKSTLIKLIATLLTPSRGKIIYSIRGNTIQLEQAVNYLCLVAPYFNIVDEFSLIENLAFYSKFKSFHTTSIDKIVQSLELDEQAFNKIKTFSSGMKQKVKLAMAFYSQAPIILLDEPTSHLDSQGINLYKYFIEKFTSSRLTIIASNNKEEYSSFADETLNLEDYK